MMGEMSGKIPSLRFPGYIDAWEQRKIGEMTVELSEYDNLQSGYPLLTSSRNGLMFQNEFRDKTSTDNEDTLFSVVPYGKCTYRHMSDDNIFHFNINKITEKGLVSREYPVFDANVNYNLEFLIQYLNFSPEFTKFCTQRKLGGTRTRLYYKNLCDFNFGVPSKAEQDKIADFLDEIDNLITLHQRKLDEVKKLKKCMLQKMFPKDGEPFPGIRFPGFTDAWEQRKLFECAEFRRGSFPQPYGNIEWYDGEDAKPFVQVADVADDMRLVEDTKQKISKLAQPMSVFAEKGSVLVTLQGSIGRVAITQYGAFVDRTVLIFYKYRQNVDKTFWAYIIKEKFIDEARKAPGGTIKTITKEVLSDFDLMLPSYREQKKIGEFLVGLDNLITLHQRKIEEIKILKKSLLQKMFV